MDTTFKGAAKPITSLDIALLAKSINVGEDHIHAFMDVEAAGDPFDSEGRPKMLFEGAKFFKNLGAGPERDEAVKQGLAWPKWNPKQHPYPRDSYPTLIKAIAINEKAALESCSWGATQIMGEYWDDCDYDSVEDMVQKFMDDADEHIKATVKLIVKWGIDDDLRAQRWSKVAEVWNGQGYRANKYDINLAARFAFWQTKPDYVLSASDQAAAAQVPVAPLVPDDYKDGKVHDEVMAVQQRLNDLGYPEVGTIDGKWGTKTAAVILAFRNDNGLPTVPDIDNKLLATMMTAKPRVIAPARANATIADLRKDGAPDVKAADNTQIVGASVTGLGLLGGAGKAVDQFSTYGGYVKTIKETIEPIQDFITQNFWVIGLAAGALIIWQTGVLKNIRLLKHQTGQDVSE